MHRHSRCRITKLHAGGSVRALGIVDRHTDWSCPGCWYWLRSANDPMQPFDLLAPTAALQREPTNQRLDCKPQSRLSDQLLARACPEIPISQSLGLLAHLRSDLMSGSSPSDSRLILTRFHRHAACRQNSGYACEKSCSRAALRTRRC